MNFGHITLDFAARRISGRRPFAVLEPAPADPVGSLRAQLAEAAAAFPHGGALGYFAYEAGALFEPHWVPRFWPRVPLFRLVCYEDLAIETPPPVPSRALGQNAVMPAMDMVADQYGRKVQLIRGYIEAGDIYQANLTHQFQLPQRCAPQTTFERLRAMSPAPYAALLEWPDFSVVSNSPESFLTVSGDTITAAPIKGTFRRGTDAQQDLRFKTWLSNSPKDLAENVMIVDLLRNDLGRVCRPGSVRVPELARLVTFPGLHHLVSRVTGQLAAGRDGLDAFIAAFPCGSITGAPKIRAMQILSLLEGEARGIPMGAIGYFGFNGDMEWNVAIRTAVFSDDRISFRAGGGIVFDSDPEAEYQEMRLKAQTLWAACSAA